MLMEMRSIVVVGCLVALPILSGCATEQALVEFSYVVEPTRGLPPGMNTITIMPAKVGPTTDAKWSEMCVTVMQSLVNESRNSFGTDIDVSDRRDTQVTFDEADLAAAGMSTAQGGSGGQLLAAQGAILSQVDIKIEKHVGRKRTLVGLSGWGGGGLGWGHIRTRQVKTVTRNITAQTSFKLVDAGNNRVWEHYAPKTFRATDRTKASPIFGSSRTEAELTPRDAIIATLVEQGAREFISRLMPCRISVEADVISSGNANCKQGVRFLRAEEYGEALVLFESAWAKNSNDHRAAFGAGVAAEASGRYHDALKFYKRARMGADLPAYTVALDRMKEFGARARR
ncbi:MAG: tetratricopeptide repeat protein [Phycisphaerales bacterium]|nr:MAG: tetratricopeptide repeat protein [Phycisphaerales bacterium]